MIILNWKKTLVYVLSKHISALYGVMDDTYL